MAPADPHATISPGGGHVSARTGTTAFQRLLVAATVALGALCCLLEPRTAWFAANLLLFLIFAGIVMGKMLTVLAGLLWRDVETVGNLLPDTDDWPHYTVLVPLYREAAVVPELLVALERLDYPQERLDVKLLLEADDAETAAALQRHVLPPWLTVMTVPPGGPRTKPHACNAGLATARGEFLVVFDAEDRPDPDQLKKAVTVFRRLPQRVACLQARLDVYNAGQSLLTRWFTLEYTAWFDLYLPGLHALRAPIPLGGTSNHFRTQVLRETGGWDAWNVTEDCDLGIRLARRGNETRILDSTTWEEATSTLGPWLRQRSRWVKGYWQTLVAHTGAPVPAMRELGVWKLCHFLLVVGGQVVSLVLNPVCVLLLLLWLWWRWPIFCPGVPLTALFYVGFVVMLLCNGLFVVVHVLAALQRRRFGLLPDTVLLPVYWLLMSAGAWRGAIQFCTRPFAWEKTPHGLATPAALAAVAPCPQTPLRSPQPDTPGPNVLRHRGPVGRGARLLSVGALLALTALIAWVATMVPRWCQFERQIRLAKVSLDRPGAEVIKTLDQVWTGKRQLQIAVDLPAGAPGPETVYKAVVYLKVLDWEWYQIATSDCRRDGSCLLVNAPLDGAWEPRRTRRPWGAWCLRRVRGLGVRVFGEEKDLGLAAVRGVVAAEEAPVPALTAQVSATPAAPRQYTVGEIRFALSREYRNPFDPAEIDITATVCGPTGAETQVAAFYGQDYRRFRGPENAEKLLAEGAPYWAIRYTPRLPGHYVWSLRGKDRHGDAFRMPLPAWEVAPAPGTRGFVGVDPKDPRYFAFENGAFFYPLAINIRSPGDSVQPRGFDFPVPADAEGTWAMETYFDRMAQAGISMARVWCAPWFAGLEWNRETPGYHGLGQYNLQNAWRLDCLLELAQARGLWLELALQSHGPFTFQYDIQWPENPYNRALGGPLSHPQEVLTHPEALRLFRNRLRYTGARYGAHPNLFAWTLWIEADAVSRSGAVLRQWHETMVPWLQQYDAGRHPVSTEFQDAFGFPEIWAMPGIAFTQLAAYNWVYDPMIRLRQAAQTMDRYPKPRLVEEYGGTSDGASMPALAAEIHDGLWGGWMLPLSATPMSWWWNFIFARNLDRFYTVFGHFIKGEDLRGVKSRFETVPLANGAGLEAWVRYGPDHAYAWVRPHYVPAIDPASWHSWRPLPLKEDPARSAAFEPVSSLQPKRFAPIAGAVLQLRGLAPGRYVGSIWETWGTDTVTRFEAMAAADGTLRVELPRLERDIALKLRLVP